MSPELDRQLSRLLRRGQDGDQEAYEEFLKGLLPVLQAFVRNRHGRAQGNDDIVQEILIAVHTARHTYDDQQLLGPWCYAIARHRLIDHWRKAKRRSDREVDDEIALQNEPAPEAAPTEALDEKLRTALDALPEKQRRAVELMKLDELSARETAQRLGMSESAVKVAAHRAYKAIRKKLKGAAENADE